MNICFGNTWKVEIIFRNFCDIQLEMWFSYNSILTSRAGIKLLFKGEIVQ